LRQEPFCTTCPKHNTIGVTYITTIQRIAEDAYVWMDRFTIRNLELYHSYNPNAVTLLDVIDKTLSPMGGLLKRWLALPLKDSNKIQAAMRLSLFTRKPGSVAKNAESNKANFLERLISKIASGKVSPREVVYLKESLDAIIPIKHGL
jgi:DNA mismatch repair protein MutS